ncbi:MAG: hypothetical protein AMXMBFR47_37040 [Planctomycetota bacterium]
MPFVAGIDEAGYGPSLGPLAVGCTVWRVDSRRLDADFWSLLGDTLARAGTKTDWKLIVDDSKSAFDRKAGIGTLERTVLAFAHDAGLRTDTLANLLADVGAAGVQADGVPWYRDLNTPLPLDPLRSKYQAVADRLSLSMDEAGVRCVGLRAEVVNEVRYNRRIGVTRNKGAVLVEQVLRLIAHAGDLAGRSDLIVHVDRLGGREDYRGLLADAFPDRHVHILEQSEDVSRYRLSTQETDWYIDFSIDADKRRLPVALASMVAKYLREALMERFNAFWRGLMPSLAATAGYYTDAQRFLKDIHPVLDRAGLRPEQFVRSR